MMVPFSSSKECSILMSSEILYPAEMAQNTDMLVRATLMSLGPPRPVVVLQEGIIGTTYCGREK
jgi:hypothetical protein